MNIPKYDIIITAVSITLLFLLFSGFIVAYLIQYQKAKNKHRLEMLTLKQTFEQTLLQSQIEIQEQTFNYISQEIHDNVGQVLSLTRVQANIMGENKESSGELLKDLKENIDKVLSDLRDIAKSLSSERIRSLGLFQATVLEAERITRSGIMQANCRLVGIEKGIDGQRKLIVFRIIQEALQNSIKHSHAAAINLLFDYQECVLEILINDNGCGFDTEKSFQQKTGLGLQNITTRATLIGGNCLLNSEPGQGTSIMLKIPYDGT